MKIIVDPNGTPSELAPDARIRFQLGEYAYIEIYRRGEAMVVRSDGWYGPLRIQPLVSNEIEVTTPSLEDRK